MTMDAAQISADASKVKDIAKSTGGALEQMGDRGTKGTDSLQHGLKRGVRDVTELTGAIGLAGDKVARFAGNLTDLIAGGINPLSATLALASVAIATVVMHEREAKEEAQKWAEHQRKVSDELQL